MMFPNSALSGEMDATAAVTSQPGTDWATWVVVAIALGLVVVLYGVYRKRMSALRAQELLAEADFEAAVLVALRSADAAPASEIMPILAPQPVSGYLPARPNSNPPTSIHSDTKAPISPSDGSHPAAQSDRADVRGGWVVDALRQAGLLEEMEGLENRHGQPSAAAILRMRRNKTALLILEMESLAATSHLLQRFDMVIVAGPRPRAVVIKSLNETIADQF